MKTSFRSDPFIFYSLTAVSFLESTVGVFVENLLPIYADDVAVTNWLTETWRPEEQEHGDRMAAFVKSAWPEFAWQSAYEDFLAAYIPLCATELLRPTPAQEALARCVTECQAAMIYKCIAAYTNDGDLAEMMLEMSKDEVGHYTVFRDIFNRYDRAERNSFMAKSKVLLGRSKLVRDADVALAVEHTAAHWRQPPPFKQLSYDQFLDEASSVMARHFPFQAAKRMILRPLRNSAWWERFAFALIGQLLQRQFRL